MIQKIRTCNAHFLEFYFVVLAIAHYFTIQQDKVAKKSAKTAKIHVE